jgi:hypothetical protein
MLVNANSSFLRVTSPRVNLNEHPKIRLKRGGRHQLWLLDLGPSPYRVQ